MAQISAADVKKLRDATGAGMMDCKKALTEADGDHDKAVEILRVSGRAKAEKIWYRALTTKFTSGTKYAAARTGTLAATADLYGSGSAEYAAVNRAWAAINVK